jgi:hypothetical protein
MPSDFDATHLDTFHDPVAGESEGVGTPGDLAAELTHVNDALATVEAYVQRLPRKFAQGFGDGTATTFTITHNLATRDVILNVMSAGVVSFPSISVADLNTVTVTYTAAPGAGSQRITVVG